MKPILVDAHQDVAYNIVSFGRDYVRSALETRRIERQAGGIVQKYNGDTLLGWPEFQQGGTALIFATLFVAPQRLKTGEWGAARCYASPDQAYALYKEQLDVYYRLADEHPDKFHLVLTAGDLQAVLTDWEDETKAAHPVGLAVLMEGAEGVRSPAELEDWWNSGVRIIGPAWSGNRFCGGTHEPGPLTAEGEALLEGMADFNFVLDVTHMDIQAALQAVDRYPGTVIASHANAAALLKGYEGNRQLPDTLIYHLLERDGVIGIVPLNQFLQHGWKMEDGRHRVSLQHVVAHIDYICQMAGDARHVGLGTDYDGGFGVQSVPQEIDTIADLRKIAPLLAEKGYTEEDIAAIFGANWLRIIRSVLPEG